MLRRKFLAAGLAASAAVISLINSSARAQGYQPVPELRYEVIPPHPPGRPMIWRPGHWRWAGGQYVWVPGAYMPAGSGYSHWVHGHWANRGGRWVWVEPHWQ
jgi:hypothetical protein